MSYTIGSDSFGEDTAGPPVDNDRWGDRIGILPGQYLYSHPGFVIEDIPDTAGGSLNPFTSVYGKS